MIRMQDANPSPLAPLPAGVVALRGLAALLLFEVAGEGLACGFALPVPGPVLGLVLLLPA